MLMRGRLVGTRNKPSPNTPSTTGQRTAWTVNESVSATVVGMAAVATNSSAVTRRRSSTAPMILRNRSRLVCTDVSYAAIEEKSRCQCWGRSAIEWSSSRVRNLSMPATIWVEMSPCKISGWVLGRTSCARLAHQAQSGIKQNNRLSIAPPVRNADRPERRHAAGLGCSDRVSRQHAGAPALKVRHRQPRWSSTTMIGLNRTPRNESKQFPPMEERQLDGLLPEPKERFLLPLLGAKRHALVAAEQAELHEVSSAPPQPVDAKVAEHFPAMGALMRRALLGMAGANQRPIGQNHRRRRAGHVKLGNGDGYLGGFDH